MSGSTFGVKDLMHNEKNDYRRHWSVWFKPSDFERSEVEIS